MDSPRAQDGENLNFLEDFDSYLDDINDRLTISRMVSDSVIKGMVNAITEEAVERIAERESEVALLNEKLHLYESGAAHKIQGLGNLRVAAENQLQVLEQKIGDLKGCNLMDRKSSDSEFSGQSGRVDSEWGDVDESLSCLKNILKNVFVEVDNLVCLSKNSVCEWEKEREFQDEVEAMVFQNSIRGLLKESEERFWEQRVQCSRQHMQIKELSCLLHDFDTVSAAFACPEMGQLFSHEGLEECNGAKRKDHLRRKISIPSSFTEVNAKAEESKIRMDETQEHAQLKHMAKDKLISYFETEMTKMKRNHESYVQQLTEEYFSLRREYLKERGPSSSLRKDKDFESLRKKIPEVIIKLEDLLTENDKLPASYEDTEVICNLKGRIDTLLSENHQLKDLIASKTKEIKSLSSQVSSAADKMSHHSSAEANLLKQIMTLKCESEDTKMEILIREDILKCILSGLIADIHSKIEDSEMEFKTMFEICEIIFKEFVKDGENTIKSDVEDSDLESIIRQEHSGIIYREAAKDAVSTFNLMKMKYEEENERRLSLEASLAETENALRLKIGEKEQLKKETVSISDLMVEKEKLVLEMKSTLMEEKKRFDQISQDLNTLKSKASQQERLISESFQESNLAKSKLEEALGQMHLYEEENCNLDQKLKLVMLDLKEATEERRVLCDIVQKKETTLSFSAAKEMEHKRQIEAIAMSLQRLYEATADFEGRTVETIERHNKRLKLLKNQCGPLVCKATGFRRVKVAYKQRLEKRYSDLQKAEAEVDLLGDEVDALLSLLEKIYIALDHYSPILQHYPGMMELLKLIKRELSGETAKSV